MATVYQAEDALLSGVIVDDLHSGSQGTFADFQNPSGDFIEWSEVEVAADGTYQLSFRYALDSPPRPLQLDVNGITEIASLDFLTTGAWNRWETVTREIELTAGINKIRLTAIGSSGANIDYLEVTPILPSPPDPPTPPQIPSVSLAVSPGVASEADATSITVTATASAPVIGNQSVGINLAGAGIEASDFLETVPTQITIADGQTTGSFALTVNDDAAVEASETVTFSLREPSDGLELGSDISGRVTITDNDEPMEVQSRYQAEDATLNGVIVDDLHSGSDGDFADYQNPNDDFIEWGNVIVPEEGTYRLDFRYALQSGSRPLQLDINGATAVASLNFSATGQWNQWEVVSQDVVLTAGVNRIRLTAVGSSGANIDYLDVTPVAPEPPVDPGCSPISLLPCTDIRLEGDRSFEFTGNDGGLLDGNGHSLGFTMVDPATNPGNPNPPGGVVGYWPELLNVDTERGVLNITTTPGIQFRANNSLDSALGVGLNLPSQPVQLQTTLLDLPTSQGGYAQGGLWFGQAEGGGLGSSEDNYIKLVALADQPGNYVLETLLEVEGEVVRKQQIDIPDNLSELTLQLLADPNAQTVTARYGIGGEANQTLTTFTQVPQAWFSFDQAGINPTIGTRSFGGIFATERQAGESQVFTFDNFLIDENPPVIDDDPPTEPPLDPPSSGNLTLSFDRWSIPVTNPTAMDWGPDGRLYVATLFGNIEVLDIDFATRTFTKQVINTVRADEGGNRLTLGLEVDPDSTPDNVVLWVGHSDGSVNNGALNSSKISRLSGPGFGQKEDVVTGLPRAIANHALNNIDFGPDGKLYAWMGGNTGAGSANTEPTEFRDRPEQVLSAAVVAIDIPKWKAEPDSFHGNVASPLGEFIDEFYARKAQELGRPFDEVTVFASGLRNTYDGVFHSNGSLYAPDNGLGITGTVPPVPRLGDPSDRNITTLLGENPADNPGTQPDPLNRIVEGGYYGHPNPYRDEVIFQSGEFQGFDISNTPASHPEYQEPFLILGTNKSANGIIEYTAENFFGELQGDLLIANFSQGDDITRVELSTDGLSAISNSSLVGGFTDPLPLEMGPDGAIFVGEFNGREVTILEPLGTWRSDLPPLPQAVLDPGSASFDGKLYAVGGKTASSHISDLYIYDPGDPLDPSDDRWTSGPDLPGAAVENPAVVALDGKVYAFGGSTQAFSGAVHQAAVFDPITSSWTILPAMPTARGGATAQVLDGKIYVLGGMGSDGASLSTVEIYDPLTNQWAEGAPLQTRRDNLGAAVIDDVLYAFGGRIRDANGSVVDATLDSMEIFDPVTGEWSFGADLPTGRRAFTVGTLNDRIQVVGGEAGPGGSAFSQHEEYNPVTGSWRSLPSIQTPRHGAAFATIDDVFYVAGGGPTAGSAFTTTVEAFAF